MYILKIYQMKYHERKALYCVLHVILRYAFIFYIQLIMLFNSLTFSMLLIKRSIARKHTGQARINDIINNEQNAFNLQKSQIFHKKYN